jgi:hypothetical protein
LNCRKWSISGGNVWDIPAFTLQLVERRTEPSADIRRLPEFKAEREKEADSGMSTFEPPKRGNV